MWAAAVQACVQVRSPDLTRPCACLKLLSMWLLLLLLWCTTSNGHVGLADWLAAAALGLLDGCTSTCLEAACGIPPRHVLVAAITTCAQQHRTAVLRVAHLAHQPLPMDHMRAIVQPAAACLQVQPQGWPRLKRGYSCQGGQRWHAHHRILVCWTHQRCPPRWPSTWMSLLPPGTAAAALLSGGGCQRAWLMYHRCHCCCCCCW